MNVNDIKIVINKRNFVLFFSREIFNIFVFEYDFINWKMWNIWREYRIWSNVESLYEVFFVVFLWFKRNFSDIKENIRIFIMNLIIFRGFL